MFYVVLIENGYRVELRSSSSEFNLQMLLAYPLIKNQITAI